MTSLEFHPERFSGVARLFPLPAPALFPRVVLPLHFFEERYLALVDDALDHDGLIAVSVLKPGWEPDYAGRPPLEPIACLGRILTHHRLDDGRYNVLLAGVGRVRLMEELEPPEAFRRAKAELLTESEPTSIDDSVSQTHAKLVEAFRSALPLGEPPEALQQVFEADTPLGLLADMAAHALPISRNAKLAALRETDVQRRALELIDAIQSEAPDREDQEDQGGGGPSTPPPFSQN